MKVFTRSDVQDAPQTLQEDLDQLQKGGQNDGFSHSISKNVMCWNKDPVNKTIRGPFGPHYDISDVFV